MFSDEGWEVTHDFTHEKGRELKNEYKVHPVHQCPTIRTYAKFDHDVVTTFRAYMDGKVRMEYEQNLEFGELQETLGVNCYLGYQKIKAVWPIAARDTY